MVPIIGDELRKEGFEVFDEWFAAGKIADDSFKEYFKGREIPYDKALKSYAAKHIFEFDKTHLDRSDAAILVLPAGRSGHLELGYMVGRGKPTFILMDEVTAEDRWDLMLQFTNGVYFDPLLLLEDLRKYI